MEILYGRNPVLESLRAGRRVHRRIALADGVREEGAVGEIARLAQALRLPIQRLARTALDRLVAHDRHQGVALETSSYPYSQLADIRAAGSADELPFLLLLDLLQDPQNVGSLLRAAEAVGVHGVVLQERRAVAITPAVVNASSGAAEHLRVARETNLVRAMRELKAAGVWLYGLEATPESIPYDRVDLSGPLGLVVGSEGAGLRRLVRETCDGLIRLPMRGRVASLNAAVAGSIALYAAWQARGFLGLERDEP